ncbi:MAG: InlB B-repeat-containing protein [Campylobacteraceae bacterium]|jgi:hypothetical protein|nr:InlB B-repeat-containing protein [Campylobacteraceae bacterium]
MFSFFSNNLTVKLFGHIAALTLFVSLLFFGCGGGSSYNGGFPSVIATYDVIFLDEDDGEIAKLNAEAGSSITVPEALEKEGYEFEGWFEVGGAQTIAAGETSYIVTGNVTFKARYQYVEIFRVAFYDANLELLWEENITQGSIVDLDNKSLEYATSWYLSKNTTKAEGIFTPDSNISFYAAPNIIEISNQEGLNSVRDNLTGKYILTGDIKLKAGEDGVDETLGWLPIGNSSSTFTSAFAGSFNGTFNGNGHTISGFWIDRAFDCVGLFGYVNAGKIKNLGLLIDEGKGVKGKGRVGAIAGYLGRNSTITNSYAKGNISGSDSRVGGIAGQLSSSMVDGSYFTGSVSGSSLYVGGIAGDIFIASSITNSYSIGNVSGDYDRIGGIVGNAYDNSKITNSYSEASVSGKNYVGGIAGHVFNNTTLTNNAAINQKINGTTDVNRISGGRVGGNATNNFALDSMEVIGTTGGVVGTSKDITQLKTKSTYEGTINGDGNGGLGWKFGDNASYPWKMDEDEGYPYLYWEDR